jgi:CheY-like chemotaxis protein
VTRRVLVVDDQPPILDLISEVLLLLGHEVVTAADGAEGAEVFEHDPTFDLVITDLLMPRLSGWELAQRLRAANPAVAIIVMAGSLDPTDLERARAVGVELLQKPVRLRDLQAAIARALGTTRTP